MYTYIYEYIYVNTYAYLHIHKNVYIHINIHTCTYICIYENSGVRQKQRYGLCMSAEIVTGMNQSYHSHTCDSDTSNAKETYQSSANVGKK